MNSHSQPHSMSRLTADPPFYKPRPFVFPRDPISPPETMTLTDGGPSTDPRQGVHEFNSPDYLHHRIHKPSISYQNSGIRDTPTRTVHRNYRFFVVVVPPLQLVQEHGQLGHTLSSGPLHRLSHGIIMPLFPTMYGQLTAIAKEFNFPSTTGLCLYLHVNENGIVMTPRISDDSWHTLWSHLFESPTTPKSPPIGGRIELDIDFHQARWYSSWLSTSREQVERPLYAPSIAPSLNHGHYDNVNRKAEDENSPELGHSSASPWAYPQTTPVSVRHVPRKLSLVERFDATSTHTESRLGGDVHSLANPDEALSTLKPLSPIPQVDEPKSAREELQNKVQTWRASAVMKPTPLTNRGQTSLEPANLPNNLSLDQNDSDVEEEPLNLADFTWSISSAHPDDDNLILFDTLSDRLPSPDIARRVIDDCPATPSTATSWGPPSSFPASPLSDFRAASLDLGFRAMFSRPLTPATATSWGPMSPAISTFSDSSRQLSVHLCDRGEYSLPVTPLTATTWGAPLSYPPTPISPEYVMTPDAAQVSFDHALDTGLEASRLHPWRYVWPYFCADILEPGNTSGLSNNGASVNLQSGFGPMRITLNSVATYPHLLIYPPVFPHFDIYPAPALSCVEGEAFLENAQIKLAYGTQYPYLQIYDPVYPHNLEKIYPQIHNYRLPTISDGSPRNPSECHYPVINIYSAVYPHFDLYPKIDRPVPFDLTSLSIHMPTLSNVYPYLVIYPSVYPNFNLYPGRAVDSSGNTDIVPVVVDSPQYGHYPFLIIYPSVYPFLDIYPNTSTELLHPIGTGEEAVKEPSSVVPNSRYPVFNLYPAVYPHFDIYPGINARLENEASVAINISMETNFYPFIRPYLSVYPFFDLYPSLSGSTNEVQYTELTEQHVFLPQATGYPAFNLYPAIYPNFQLYPSISGIVNELGSTTRASFTAVTRWKVRKAHRDLHLEVFGNNSVHMSSGISVSPIITTLPQPSRRSLSRTRSPTGPGNQTPTSPPALPTRNDILPTPLRGLDSSSGLPQAFNHVPRTNATFRIQPQSEISRSRSLRSPENIVKRPSPYKPLNKSVDLTRQPDEQSETNPPKSSILSRANSVGHNGRSINAKSRIRDSFVLHMARAFDNQSLANGND